LKTLPADYIGPRHTVTVKQLATDSDGHEWFQWEERPGPAPAADVTGSNDETLIHVCYVEAQRGALAAIVSKQRSCKIIH
jgi:hypothetical protein